MITVNFRSDVQEFTERHFPKNVPISVYGKVAGLLGIGEVFQHVRLEVLNSQNESIYFDEDTTNTFGNYAFYIVFPNEDANYTIVVTTTFSASGQETAKVPVAVGDAKVIGEAPKPEEQGTTLTTTIQIAIILAGIVLILYGAKTIKEIAT